MRIVYPKDEKSRIKANWAPKIRTSIHGCIDNEGEITITKEDRANGTTFCKFLEEIVKQYPGYQVFMIFIDRIPYHRSKMVREYIYNLRNRGYNFKLIWLPRYSPNLNPIEEEWRPIKKRVHNKVITTIDEMQSAIDEEIHELSGNCAGILSSYFPTLFG